MMINFLTMSRERNTRFKVCVRMLSSDVRRRDNAKPKRKVSAQRGGKKRRTFLEVIADTGRFERRIRNRCDIDIMPKGNCQNGEAAKAQANKRGANHGEFSECAAEPYRTT